VGGEITVSKWSNEKGESSDTTYVNRDISSVQREAGLRHDSTRNEDPTGWRWFANLMIETSRL
jgi:hypothetical protein